MDPIAALSLACNVMQVVGLGLKAVQICKQVHQEGSSTHNQTLTMQSRYLEDATIEMEQDLTRVSLTKNPLTPNETRLRDIAIQCAKTATRLKVELKKLERKGGKPSSMKVAFKTLLKRDAIEEIRVEMSSYQMILQTQILVHMRSEQARSVREDESRFQRLDQKIASFIQDLTGSQIQISTLIQSEQEETRLLVVDEGRDVKAHIDQNYETMKLDASAEESQQRLLASLRYLQMDERWNSVKDSHETTYEWLFNDVDVDKRPWSPLVPFFKSDDPLYWIRGKPGSGKSCLTKMICTDNRIYDALREPRQDMNISVIRFFFWLPGIELQRNSRGLWCSLLCQLLEQNRTIIPQLRAEISTSNHMTDITSWSLKELYHIFGRSLELIDGFTCIFLDGLDEFDPGEGPIEITRHIERLMAFPRVKLCVSSRPEPHLERWLRRYPHLRLEQLTENDIRQYARDILRGASMGDSFDEISDAELSHLQDMVVAKANGVFLWVYYSLNSLVRGLLGGDNWTELTERLEQLPNEITDLFNHMWNRLNEDKALYRAEAATYFRFVLDWSDLTNNEPCTMVGATIAANIQHLSGIVLEQGHSVPLAAFAKQCRTTELRLLSRCAGLLEITDHDPRSLEEPPEMGSFSGKLIRFIHRSVYDFLRETEHGKHIMGDCQDSQVESSILYFNIHLLEYMIMDPLERVNTLIENLLNTGFGRVIQRLPYDTYMHNFHLLVRSLQRRWNVEVGACPLDGWNFAFATINLHSVYGGPMGPATDFVGKAASCGYNLFVQSFLDEVGVGRKLSPKYLDYLLLCASDLQRTALWGPHNGSLPAMLNSLTLVQAILRRGADPNSRHRCRQTLTVGSKVLSQTTSAFLQFLFGSSINNSWFTRDAEFVSAWQTTLQSFISAGADLECSVPIVVGHPEWVDDRARLTEINFFHPLTEGSTRNGAFIVIEMSVVDLIKAISSKHADLMVSPIPELERTAFKTKPRVSYLWGLRRDKAAKHSTVGFLEIQTDEDSETIFDAVTDAWTDIDDYWDGLRSELLKIVDRSKKLEGIDQMYEGFAEKGWISDLGDHWPDDVGEPFENEDLEGTALSS